MPDKRCSKLLLAASGIVLASWCMSSIANGAAAPWGRTGFKVISESFEDGALIPDRMTMTADANRPVCPGQNISPQLSWTGVPPGTRSFVITMITTEVPDINMVVYGIPGNVTSLAEGELSQPSDKFVGGKNRFGFGTWRGPCNQPGLSTHHYMINVTATELDTRQLAPGLTLEEVRAELRGHGQVTSTIIAKQKPPS